jgi:hypothetical protein
VLGKASTEHPDATGPSALIALWFSRQVERCARQAGMSPMPGAGRSKAFRALRARVTFLCWPKEKVTKRKGLPRQIYSSRPDTTAWIATLGILPRVATARIVRAALRVSLCDSAIGVEEIRLWIGPPSTDT